MIATTGEKQLFDGNGQNCFYRNIFMKSVLLSNKHLIPFRKERKLNNFEEYGTMNYLVKF